MEKVPEGDAVRDFQVRQEMAILRRENNARRLQAMTFSCLGKLDGVGAHDFKRWKRALSALMTRSVAVVPREPLVIGLAESGIIPSALFHQVLTEVCRDAGWICSTRRPAQGIYFSESHSHAPHHVLPIPSKTPSEIWFVEDELTTGRTLLQVALKACRSMDVRRVRFFAFADTRTRRHRKQFNRILRCNGLRATLHAFDRMPEPDRAGSPNNDLSVSEPATIPGEMPAMTKPERHWHFPDRRPGLALQQLSEMAPPRGMHGSLLAVGEAVDLGIRVVQANPKMRLHHITLSPWEVDGRHIRSRLRVGPDYYLYNYHRLKPPVYLLNDPIDAWVGQCAARLLAGLKMPVEILRWPGVNSRDF